MPYARQTLRTAALTSIKKEFNLQKSNLMVCDDGRIRFARDGAPPCCITASVIIAGWRKRLLSRCLLARSALTRLNSGRSAVAIGKPERQYLKPPRIGARVWLGGSISLTALGSIARGEHRRSP